jgi:hypothetical protein
LNKSFSFLINAIIIILLTGLSISCSSQKNFERQLLLGDYSNIFSADTLIIIGETASAAELQAADTLSKKLTEQINNGLVIQPADKTISSENMNHNLILIGVADSNSILNEVYQKVHSSGITAGYPGTNKGILEIMTNIWNPDKSLLIVAGSDQRGLQSGIMKLSGGGSKSTSMEITDWTELTGVTFPIDSETEAVKYAKLDPDVIAFMQKIKDSGLTTGSWASFDKVEKVWAVGIAAKNAHDIWFEIHFRTDGTVISNFSSQL